MERMKVGEVFKYYAKPEVAAIRLTDGSLKVGDEIQIQGATTDFTQVVESMEIERERVESAGVGQSVGIKVRERARPGDVVYKLVR
jgi:putative protease